MDNPNGCAWCNRPAHIRQGRILLCAIHYRISSMRSSARRHGKAIPSRAEIEAMVPSPLVCLGCEREMAWLRDKGTSQQITLQHDRGGGLRLICFGCNTRRASHPGDSFYQIPAGQKRCPDCEQVLPLEAFVVDRSRPIGRKSYCRSCSSQRFKNWRKSHAA